MESEDIVSIKENEVMERIGAAVDELDLDGLASLHNHLTNYEPIDGDDIKLIEGWHLIPKKGAH